MTELLAVFWGWLFLLVSGVLIVELAIALAKGLRHG